MLQKKPTKILKNGILRKPEFLLFLIVLFGLIFRVLFFSGIGTSDDLSYSRYSYDILDIGIDPDSVLSLSSRVGILYVTAFSYELFGVNDFSSVIFILLTSIGNIILAYFFGRLLGNEKVGLMAAFLLSIFPLEVIYSTKLLTDMPSAFFMALGVYLFLYSEKKNKLKINYFLSGIFIGIGYIIRESVILIVLFFLLYVIYKRGIKKEYFLVAIGFIIMFIVELISLYILTGNPFFKFTVIPDYLLESYILYDYFGRLNFPQGLFHYPYIILTNSLVSSFYIFIFVSILYLIKVKKKETYLMLLWFIPLLLYLSFGSASFTQYLPFVAKARYLTIITIPGVLLLAFFLVEKNHFIKRAVMPLALAILLLTSVVSVYLDGSRNLLSNLRDSYPTLSELGKTIYIDSRSVRALNYISGYENKLDLREYPDGLANVEDAYVVINKDMIRRLKEANKKRIFPKEIDNPPENWLLVNKIGKEDINKIIIYYAP
jgi:hypothetical protein